MLEHLNQKAFVPNIDSIATKIAAALLLKDKTISVSDIRAIPFIETDEDAMMVARHLVQMFDVEVEQKKQSSGISQWVDVLRLKPARPQKTAP